MKRTSILVLTLALVAAGQQPGQMPPRADAARSDPQADAKRFADIVARHQRGEQIDPADVRWAMQYQREHQQGAGPDSPSVVAWRETHPSRESTGLVPLPDLGKGTYQGEEGGLYPNGEKSPPPAHLGAGRALARQIAPLDGNGQKSNDGKIVFLSIGMSNTTMEFQAFQKLAAREKLNPNLVIVDGAQGGQTAAITARAESNFWKVVDDRLQKAAVTARQVQAAWIKQANGRPTEGFPDAAKKLQADVIGTLHVLHLKFPNLKIAYLSSRIYGGYALTPLNPEPYAYEGGFAMKWAIAGQIGGKPELNYDPTKGEVRSPWIAWGPYLWTDGTKGRKQDGMVWLAEDCVPADRTHPSESGREKVARMLLTFLKTDPAAEPWFVGK
jgi:hypothetical protein